MAELYGIHAHVIQGDAQRPVSSKSCVVYFGAAAGTDAGLGEAHHINSYNDYVTFYHNGTEPSNPLSLDMSAKVALSMISDAWFVNCNDDGDSSEDATTGEIIAGYMEDALAAICLNSSDVPNIICVPCRQDATLLAKLVQQCKGGINNTIHAQGFVDCAQAADQISDGNPVANKIEAPSVDGCLVACWGNIILERNANGTAKSDVPASIVFSARRAEQDASNTNNVPYRSIGNLRIDCKGLCIDVSGTKTECTCRQDKMNEVVENGIVSLVNKGNNRWFSWGDHTAAVTAGDVEDETYRFDSTVAVLYHILNRFIGKWGDIIDQPMSLMLRDCIVAEEQDYLNSLKAMGCLVGDPRCEFRSINNTVDTIGKGQFYFNNICTVVPPAKYVDLAIQYTDAGLAAYITE